MRFRARSGLVLVALLCGLLLPTGGPAAAPGATSTYRNPVLPLDFPDPFVA